LIILLVLKIMYNPKIHLDPFKNMSYDPYDEDCSDHGYCGTYLSEAFDNSTNDEKEVTCKKCIKLFQKAKDEMKMHMVHQINDMGEFVAFHNKEYISLIK
jgi:hypothetical protein